MTKIVRVIVIDPSKIFYQGLCAYLSQGGYVVLGQARNPAEMVPQLGASPLDLAVVGPNLAEHENLAACRELINYWPGVKLIVLSAHADDPLFQADVAYAGAAACLSTTTTVDEFLKTIDWVMAGRQLFPREIMVQAFQPLELTMREIEVLKQMAQGTTNAEIADALVVQLSTVRSHRQRILGKLAVHNINDAVRRARRRGLV